MTNNASDALQAIQERNARVEAEKAWETSRSRRMSILGIIYITATIFLYGIDAEHPLVQGLVPAGGYLLSTLSLPWMKKRWIQKYHESAKS